MNAVVGLLVVFCSFLLLDSSHQVINLQNSLYSFEIPSLVTCSWFFLWNQNKKWNKKRFSFKSVIIYLKIFFFFILPILLYDIIYTSNNQSSFSKNFVSFFEEIALAYFIQFYLNFLKDPQFFNEGKCNIYFFLLIILRYIDYW